jgi:phosphohistidine phosphatase
VDPRRPLSEQGRAAVEALASAAAVRGVKPAAVWHSGKLRAKQTAEAFWRACNALADFHASRDLQPDDPPEWIRDRLLGETHDVLDVVLVGHFPHLPRLLALLVKDNRAAEHFPLHGCVLLESLDEGQTWNELWRLP